MVLENRVFGGNMNSIFTWSPVFVGVATEHALVDSDYCHCWPFVVAEGMECARTEVLLWSSVAHLPFFPRNLNRSKESHQSFVIFWVDAEDHWLHVYRWMLSGKKRQFPFNVINKCQWYYSTLNSSQYSPPMKLPQNSGPQFWSENILWLVHSINLMYSFMAR